jgi:hypothetical protein
MWPEEYLKKIEGDVKKSLNDLKKEGITTVRQDGKLNNLIFSKGDKEIRISHHSYYRYSGRGMKAVKTGKKDDDFEYVSLPLSDYLGMMKAIVLKRLS